MGIKKIYGLSAISVFFVLLGFFVFVLFSFYNSLPKTKGEIALKGLTEEVKIINDKWGVPHLFAQNEKDLFFATGYVHAKERMWQMELTRRAGFGRLSEIFGKATVEKDKFMRNLGLKEAAAKDYEKLNSQFKDFLLSYCQGVNSWLSSRKFNWPPEFLLLRFRPEPWTIMDSLIIKEIMAFLLSMDFPSEVVRSKLVKRLGAENAIQILEEGVDIPSAFEEVIEFPKLNGNTSLLPFSASNSWVLGGSRTQSGKPLLANDPHLEISLPPIWHEIHLSCPSLDVIGITLPGIPLVIIGHNEKIAWGLTASMADVQDLYMEKLDSSKENYRDLDIWKPLLKKEELIKVKGERLPQKFEIAWTNRGPIITPLIVQSQVPVSLSWTIYEGGRAFESFYLLNKAQDWQEFVEAVKLFEVPSHNFVYADIQGNIGYYLSGKIPLRKKEAALFPFPGWKEEGNWTGFLEEEKKPNLYNPDEDFIVTANNKIIPEDFPYYISCDWLSPFRALRIKELLLQQEKHNIESLQRIQNDVFSKKAELFLAYVKEIKEARGKVKDAFEIIKNWDLKMTFGKEAALFEVFMNFFQEEVFKDDFGKDFKDFDSLFSSKQAGLLRILSDPLSPWYDKKETQEKEGREEIIVNSLTKAYEWLEKNYGSPEKWDWMKMHSIRFKHPLSQVPLFRFFSRGPYPLDGDDFTVRASFNIFSPSYETTHGASYRQIVDLADWRNSVCVVTSGQSGHFLSPHYDDQIPLWLEGKYHPMLFFPEDIEAEAEGTTILKPGKKAN